MPLTHHRCAQAVAVCNTYTCQLLLNAALATDTSSFEELAYAIGGVPFMVFAQASNIILLIGVVSICTAALPWQLTCAFSVTLCSCTVAHEGKRASFAGNITGDLCLLADLGTKSLRHAWGDAAPAILTDHHGRGAMLLLTVAVIFPLSLSRGLRALEHASTAGLGVLLLLFAVLTADAVGSGFRGITSGDVPLWSVNWHSSHIAEAFSLIGYSFYLHPLMMPMLREMPPGAKGVGIMSDAVTVVIMGVALVTYSYVGAMGAAAFGKGTAGDVMMNHLLDSHWASLVWPRFPQYKS